MYGITVAYAIQQLKRYTYLQKYHITLKRKVMQENTCSIYNSENTKLRISYRLLFDIHTIKIKLSSTNSKNRCFNYFSSYSSE